MRDMQTLDCPGCHREITIEPDEIGQPLKCGQCGATFKPVTATASTSTASPSARQVPSSRPMIACPSCRKFVQIAPESIGRWVSCRECGMQFAATEDKPVQRSFVQPSNPTVVPAGRSTPSVSCEAIEAGSESMRLGFRIVAGFLGGVGLLIGGLLFLHGCVMDTTVQGIGVDASGFHYIDRFHNTGLMHQSTIEVIGGLGLAGFGLVLVIAACVVRHRR
jgi:ribosomal protein L37AE/L43A